MGVAAITQLLLFAVVARIRSELPGSYQQASQHRTNFGELLKPPPPPLANIVPVPFHGGASNIAREQRQHTNLGYDYQPPPPPPPSPPLGATSNFKFPSPFYKQYNFNFVPPPQPFSTPPSPSIFQKVSGWLFPSAQSTQPNINSYDTNHLGPIKKDCNPCNLAPWIPVIKYNQPKTNINLSSHSTYGPPSPTAVIKNSPEPFQYSSQQFQPSSVDNLNYQLNDQVSGLPHANYGLPTLSNTGFNKSPVSTYGPPSPTHTIVEIQKSSSSSSTDDHSLSNNNNPSSLNNLDAHLSVTPGPTYGLAHTTEIEIIKSNTADNEFHLPKVYYPNGFKNSYGELITNNYASNVPYVHPTAAEASKIRTEIAPFVNTTDTSAHTVAQPSPFASNRGRNIHTLQPVALPNLSVSPLPPIFNARPFKNFPPPPLNGYHVHGINNLKKQSSDINVVKSVPVAEFTHSIEYPPTVIQSPVVDLDLQKRYNQSKSYRNIPNVYTEEEFRDVSSQASEDHIAATKTGSPDTSFETTGNENENDIYDNGFLPNSQKDLNGVPYNHRPYFEDLRGVPDDAVDKYRTESNLKALDSPLLYLKPSAPHKEFDNFLPTPVSQTNDYEIYDDIPTTTPTSSSTVSEIWDKYKGEDYSDTLSSHSLVNQAAKNPKILQIIIPYTTNQNSANNLPHYTAEEQWSTGSINENQGRKIPSNTENNLFNTITDQEYSTQNTNILEVTASDVEDSNNGLQVNTQDILNDLYDIKEQPFDIIKLQNNIDVWTEQEFSKHVQNSEDLTGKYAHAKQIPDDFFTTISPITNYATTIEPDYNFYDHEASSSMQHSVLRPLSISTTVRPRKEYNTIVRSKNKTASDTKDKAKTKNNLDSEHNLKPHISTAASAFRSTSTTLAPWGTIQTSISPLTKEKVYVVTSKPWREKSNGNVSSWHEGFPFDFKRTTSGDNSVSSSDDLPFKSPRFSNRPSIVSPDNGSAEFVKGGSFAFSKTWHQNINNLEAEAVNVRNHTSPSEGPLQQVPTNMAERSFDTSAQAPDDGPNV